MELSRIFRPDMLVKALLTSLSQKHSDFLLGAFAELIDNSIEARSTKLCIDWNTSNPLPAIIITDNGWGMSRKELYELVSFSAEKGEQNYSVGFKSGSFALGTEAVVFTKSYEMIGDQKCIMRGMTRISSHLNKYEAPLLFWWPDGSMVESKTADFAISTDPDKYQRLSNIECNENHPAFMKMVATEYPYNIFPPYEAKNKFQSHFDEIKNETGTRILIYHHLRGGKFRIESAPEDFDIVIVPAISNGEKPRKPREDSYSAIDSSCDVPIDYSLRAYLEVLYRPHTPDDFQTHEVEIMLLGKIVSPRAIECDFFREATMTCQVNLSSECELDRQGGKPERKSFNMEFDVKYGYNGEYDENGLSGHFIYFDGWSKDNACEQRKFRLGSTRSTSKLPARLIYSFFALELQRQAIGSGHTGILVVKQPAFLLDNGKQKFDARYSDVLVMLIEKLSQLSDSHIRSENMIELKERIRQHNKFQYNSVMLSKKNNHLWPCINGIGRSRDFSNTKTRILHTQI